MSQYARPNGFDAPAYVLTTGVKLEPRWGDPATKGVTLASGTTYVFPVGGESGPLASIHLIWDAAIIVVWTFETCNAGSSFGSADKVDVSEFDSVVGNWVQENPSTAYIATAVAGGVVVANMTLTVAGGTQNGATVHVGNFGTRRMRVKAVVGGTGGVVRVLPHGKM